MGIDGIEFDKSHHQNLGTFQETWLFQNFLFGSNLDSPGQITFKKYNRKSIF